MNNFHPRNGNELRRKDTEDDQHCSYLSRFGLLDALFLREGWDG